MISETVDIACNFLFLCGAVATEYFPDKTMADELGNCWSQHKLLAEARRPSNPQNQFYRVLPLHNWEQEPPQTTMRQLTNCHYLHAEVGLERRIVARGENRTRVTSPALRAQHIVPIRVMDGSHFKIDPIGH